MQQLVDAGVSTDAFLKALAGGVVRNEKAKLKPHVRLYVSAVQQYSRGAGGRVKGGNGGGQARSGCMGGLLPQCKGWPAILCQPLC